uniref:Cyclic nucleotide-binding domain-containing protein n=1 Tax=Trichobilharzia regenti TaxID=157069 RepID=A0AA85IS51_TRIRE|nr:unnamed protein product [Trichobilharzia regenti]
MNHKNLTQPANIKLNTSDDDGQSGDYEMSTDYVNDNVNQSEEVINYCCDNTEKCPMTWNGVQQQTADRFPTPPQSPIKRISSVAKTHKPSQQCPQHASGKDDPFSDTGKVTTNEVGKNWKNVKNTMRFVLSNKLKNKYDYDDSRRDSFMSRFSTQRRGSYTQNRENDHRFENPQFSCYLKPVYKPGIHNSNNNNNNDNTTTNNINNNKMISDKGTSNDEFFQTWFVNTPESDEKHIEVEHLIKSTPPPHGSLEEDASTGGRLKLESTTTSQSCESQSPVKSGTDGYQNVKYSENSIPTDYVNNMLMFFERPLGFFVFHSNSYGYLIWLTFVSLALLYNLWAPIARQAFTELQTTYQILWFSLDALADLAYLIDIFVQCNTSYLKCGLKVRDHQKLAIRYVKSYAFLFDIFSLLPLDLLQLKIGVQPMLRFPRFLKLYRCREWKVRVENRTIFPNLWRVLNLIHILFLGCHWFAAFYYLLSKYEGFKNPWGYQPSESGDNDTISRIYLKSFYWATLTLTTIGDLSAPTSSIELTFTIVSYLTGVFVFATIVGQVGNIITTRNADRIEFEKILDNAKSYMRANSVSKDLQSRILRWYDYAWSKGCGGGGQDINTIGLLPDKLKTELALNVNLETLKKVTIFHECRPEFLHDIVLKMRPLVFTPGDLICRKGEIAREIFIIADGVLEVISETNEVLSRMSAGDFFGEIGVLNVDGVNKRTADVRAVGYAELFVLSREDILKALKDHPEAEVVIRKHATRRLYETRERQYAYYMHGKKSTTSHGSVNRTSNATDDNAAVKFEIPQIVTPQNSITEILHDKDDNSTNQLVSTYSSNPTEMTSKNSIDISDANRLSEALDQFADRWESILMNVIKNYRKEINVLREQILQTNRTNTN